VGFDRWPRLARRLLRKPKTSCSLAEALKGGAKSKVLASKLLAKSWQNEYFEDTTQYGRSPPTKYTWYHSPDFAIVVAQRKDGHVPLVRQYRYGARQAFWELPAGLLEGGESPVECAKREFEEEVGHRLVKPRQLATIHTVPSRSDQRAFLFTGGVGEEVERKVDNSERLVLRFVSVKRANELLSWDINAVHYLSFLIWRQMHQRYGS
jgi:8-oxo-dGTP pyrophosphatase MutT (NUDIX family)